jgi:hypothetical protein
MRKEPNYGPFQPEWAFELIVTGLDNYDAMVKMVLDDYFSKKYVQDGQTLWYWSRFIDEAYYCFMMRDLSCPRQIYEVNAAGGFHESTARKLKMVGASVSGNLSDVHTQIQNLRRDVDRGFEQMDKHIEQVSSPKRTIEGVHQTDCF